MDPIEKRGKKTQQTKKDSLFPKSQSKVPVTLDDLSGIEQSIKSSKVRD